MTGQLPDDAVTAAMQDGFDAWWDESQHHVNVMSIGDECWRGLAYDAAFAAYQAGWEAAAPAIAARVAADERERIRQLAIDHDAHVHRCSPPCRSDEHGHNMHPFADLIGDAP